MFVVSTRTSWRKIGECFIVMDLPFIFVPTHQGKHFYRRFLKVLGMVLLIWHGYCVLFSRHQVYSIPYEHDYWTEQKHLLNPESVGSCLKGTILMQPHCLSLLYHVHPHAIHNFHTNQSRTITCFGISSWSSGWLVGWIGSFRSVAKVLLQFWVSFCNIAFKGSAKWFCRDHMINNMFGRT